MVLLGVGCAKYIFIKRNILRGRLVDISGCSVAATLSTEGVRVNLLVSRKLVLREVSGCMHLWGLGSRELLDWRRLMELIGILMRCRGYLLLSVDLMGWTGWYMCIRRAHRLHRRYCLRSWFYWRNHLRPRSLYRRSMGWSFPMQLIRLVGLELGYYIAWIFS